MYEMDFIDKVENKLIRFIDFLNNKRMLNSRIFSAIAIGVIGIIVFYYRPFWADVNYNGFWKNLYNVINPFVVAPYFIGVISIFVFACYRSFWFKVLIDFLYVFSIMISFVSVMGMRYWWEGIIFVPHTIFIILQVAILIIRQRQYRR